jgi:DNA-directed RNA polymerase specialized sigma24 family protein
VSHSRRTRRSEDLRTRIQDALGRLPARQREVIARYYGDELTLREAGAKMGVSEARACQLHGRAIQSLRHELAVRTPSVPARMAPARVAAATVTGAPERVAQPIAA